MNRLIPQADAMEVLKFTEPKPYSRVRAWKIEMMRFVPHSGRASQ